VKTYVTLILLPKEGGSNLSAITMNYTKPSFLQEMQQGMALLEYKDLKTYCTKYCFIGFTQKTWCFFKANYII